MTKQTELLILEDIKPLEFFKGNKAQSFLQSLEKAVEQFKATRDVSTPKGRAEIKSFAHSIAKRKSPIEKAKLELTSKLREQVTNINEDEKVIQARIKVLQDDVRQPLTDFEEKEKERIEERRLRIARIEYFQDLTPGHAELEITAAIKDVKELKVFDWQEFATKAEDVSKKILDHLNSTLAKIKIHIAEKEQLEKLLKEKAARDQKEREEQIIRETEENIRRVERETAERIAREVKQERYRLEAEKKAAEAREQQAKLELEAQKEAAKLRVEENKRAVELAKINADVRAREAERLVEEQKKQAKIQADRETEAVLKKEREKFKLKKEAEIEAEKAREADIKHRTKINNEALDALILAMQNEGEEKPWGDFTESYESSLNFIGKLAIRAIAKGKISHVSIKY